MTGYYDMGGDAYTSFTYGYGDDSHDWDDRDDEADPDATTHDTTSKETT